MNVPGNCLPCGLHSSGCRKCSNDCFDTALTGTAALQDAGKLQAEASAEAEGKSPAKGKKPSAAVRAMQQQVEERRRAEEEAAAAAEAQRIANEEAARQAELELQQEEEERIRKAEEKKAQREQMRKEGKLLSTKQKAEARKLAVEREQRLAKAQVCELHSIMPQNGPMFCSAASACRKTFRLHALDTSVSDLVMYGLSLCEHAWCR